MKTEMATPKFHKFEDIIAWQKAQDLAVIIYQLFGKCKDYEFKDEICKTSVSISSLIADGHGQKNQKEFLQTLNTASGACSRLESLLHLAFKIQYLDEQTSNQVLQSCNDLSKILFGLKKSIKNKMQAQTEETV
ncbi:MAG: four helix bundle protein [Saprospiraceae bacterium]|nr:four helix bundle protein [Saprospiraceae bacterium]